MSGDAPDELDLEDPAAWLASRVTALAALVRTMAPEDAAECRRGGAGPMSEREGIPKPPAKKRQVADADRAGS